MGAIGKEVQDNGKMPFMISEAGKHLLKFLIWIPSQGIHQGSNRRQNILNCSIANATGEAG